MPVEDHLRRDEECRPPLSWDEAGEQGDQCPVRPGEAGSADLASKDCHLVAQHKDLGVLGERVPPRQSKEFDGAMDESVQEREQHGAAASPTPSWLVKVVASSFWTLQANQRGVQQPRPPVLAVLVWIKKSDEPRA